MSRAEQITRRIAAGVAAVLAQDRSGFDEAVIALAGADLEIVSRLEAAVVRELLEDVHPAGLTGDDIRAALERTARTTIAWWPELNVEDLIAVYTSALGMADPDAPSGDRIQLARHGLLVIADLAATVDGGVQPYLESAVAEIHRAETVEMP